MKNQYRYAYVAIVNGENVNLLITTYREMICHYIRAFFLGPYNEEKWVWLPPWTLMFVGTKEGK